MKIGDKVIADGSIGIIVGNYNKNNDFDFEIAFINNAPSNCWLDCYKKENLKLYNWKTFPKTFIEKLKLLFTKKVEK